MRTVDQIGEWTTTRLMKFILDIVQRQQINDLQQQIVLLERRVYKLEHP